MESFSKEAVKITAAIGSAILPREGAFHYAQIDGEWISYSGVKRINDSKEQLVGVKRGLLGTQAKDHSGVNLSLSVPLQLTGLLRGQFGTIASKISTNTTLHLVGVLTNLKRAQNGTTTTKHSITGADKSKISVYSSINDIVRMVATHETAHVIIDHPEDPNNEHADDTIMTESVTRGAYVGNRIFTDFSKIVEDFINAN